MNGANIKLYKNDKLILDCTICTNPEGRIGWWDAVEGKFHDQTENLLKQAYSEPMGTQYIDTGVPYTNADHIRSMTDEELAHLMAMPYCDRRTTEECRGFHGECPACVLDWLKQLYKEEK